MNTNPSSTDCCIIGGGPAGLLLALLLARRGRSVRVMDRRERLDAEGAAHEPFLSPPSLELLERLGLLEGLRPHGQAAYRVVESGADGRHVSLDYGKNADGLPPYALSLSIPDLTRALLRALDDEPSVTLMPGTTVRSLRRGESGRWSIEALHDGTVIVFQGGYLVGCDGKFSRIRESAGIGAEVFTFDRPLTIVELALPTDWPEQIFAHRGSDSSLTATMPVAGGGLTLLWAEDPQKCAESRRRPVSETHEHLASAVPELGERLRKEFTSWDQVFTVTHHVVRPERWHDANLALLGDSAHGVHSFGAQGLNLAFQDALALSDSIGDAEAGDPGPLKVYEELRRTFVERFQSFQQRLDVLSSSTGRADDSGEMYGPIAQVMAVGQAELRPMYGRVPAPGTHP